MRLINLIFIFSVVLLGLVSGAVTPVLAFKQDVKKAEALEKQGKPKQALAQLKKAGDKIKAEFGERDIWFGWINWKIARLSDELGLYAAAEKQFKIALKLYEKEQGPTSQSVADLLNNIGTIYHKQSRDKAAIPLYLRSLKIFERDAAKHKKSIANLLNNLGVSYMDIGNYPKALTAYQKSLKIKEEMLGADHPLVAITLYNMAYIYSNQKHRAQSIKLVKRALKIQEAFYGRDHPAIAAAITNLATLYRIEGRVKEAIPLYKRALKIEEVHYGADHPNLVVELNQLATIYRTQRQYDLALSLLKRAQVIGETRLGKTHPSVAESIEGQAKIYVEQQNIKAAVLHFQRALKIKKSNYGTNEWEIANLYNSLSNIHWRRRDYKAAYAYNLQATTMITRLADKYRLQGNAGVGVVSSNYMYFSRARLAYVLAMREKRQGSLYEHDRFLNEAFRAAQRGQAGETSLAITQMGARFASGDSKLAKLVRNRQDLIKSWQKLDRALIGALGVAKAKQDSIKISTIRTNLEKIERNIALLDDQLKTGFPAFSDFANPSPLSIRDVQDLLSPDEALLFFMPLRDRLVVWSVSKDGADWQRTNIAAKDLGQRIAALRAGLNLNDILSDKAQMFDLEKSYELYQALFPVTIEKNFVAKKKLLIVAAGPLSGLPFNVLVTEAPREAVPEKLTGYREAAWLAKRYSLVVLPSVNSLRALRKHANKGRASKAMVGFGNPDFGGGDAAHEMRGKQVTALNVRSFDQFFRGGIVDVAVLGKNLPQLPDTEDELKTVALKLGSAKTTIKLGHEATETALKTMRLDEYKIVYFATHGLVAGELKQLGAKNQAEPALALTVPPKGTKLDDGLLTASEITQLKLNADWVVLSACNTAAGDGPGAEALSGLSRAFIYAGARSLLVSHWPVVSSAAVKLTTKLFDLKKNDQKISKAEALQQSMLALMNDTSEPINAYPAVWAPFIIVGDGR